MKIAVTKDINIDSQQDLLLKMMTLHLHRFNARSRDDSAAWSRIYLSAWDAAVHLTGVVAVEMSRPEYGRLLDLAVGFMQERVLRMSVRDVDQLKQRLVEIMAECVGPAAVCMC